MIVAHEAESARDGRPRLSPRRAERSRLRRQTGPALRERRSTGPSVAPLLGLNDLASLRACRRPQRMSVGDRTVQNRVPPRRRGVPFR